MLPGMLPGIAKVNGDVKSEACGRGVLRSALAVLCSKLAWFNFKPDSVRGVNAGSTERFLCARS